MITLRALLLLASFPAAALAQAPAGEAPPPPPPEAPAQPDAPPAEGQPAPPAESTPATPSLEDRLTHVEGKVEGMEESSAATSATVDALKRIKVSGYIQGQYEWHDDAGAGLDAQFRANRGTNRFRVRRGRLKTLYQGTMSEYMLQIDATPDGVTLKDAEATLVLDETVFPSPTPWEVRLTMGQFKAPFGFELLQSSGDREMPERSRMLAIMYPGERDRGVRLMAKYGAFRLNTAIINGNVFPAVASYSGISTTITDPIAGSIDQSSAKDFVGRLGADLGFLVFGASFHYGSTIQTTAGRAAAGTAPAVATTYQRFRRTRVGADAQFYQDIPMVGGLVLRGEFIYAIDKNRDYSGVVANPCRDLKSLGWSATLVQNVGDHFGVVFRADQFDKNANASDACLADPAFAMLDSVKNSRIDKVTTFGGGVLIHVSGNLKATAIYEHVAEQGTNAVDNDVFTLRMQAKF